MSIWEDDRDEMSMDMLTDVDEEEMDEEVCYATVRVSYTLIPRRCKNSWMVS
jgi:hypothetical protein